VYELIMGKPPFEGKTDEQTTSNILNLPIRSADLPGIMSPECRDFIEKVRRLYSTVLCCTVLCCTSNILNLAIRSADLPGVMSRSAGIFIEKVRRLYCTVLCCIVLYWTLLYCTLL